MPKMQKIVAIMVAGLCTLGAWDQASPGASTPLGTAFTYQGQLKQSGANVNGMADFQFSLWDAVSGSTQIGSTQNLNAIPVANGIFTVQLDFGTGAFTSQARWLEITVNGQTLTPRQPITAAPFALFALNGNDGEIKKRKPIDEIFANTRPGVSENDDHLFFPMLAGEVWEYELWIRVDAESVGKFCRYKMEGPTGAIVNYVSDHRSHNNASNTGIAQIDVPAGSVTFSVYDMDGVIRIRGTVANGSTPGNFQFIFRNDTAVPATIRANSFIKASRLN